MKIARYCSSLRSISTTARTPKIFRIDSHNATLSKLIDSAASYGFGLETFALGFPVHLDWSWRTLLNKDWEDVLFAYPAIADGLSGPNAGSTWFRRVKFSIWIGYDF